MIKLDAIKSEKIWGYELWAASTHKNGCQKEFLDLCKKDYPVLVKVIQANDILSLQVHPDDQKAVELEGEGNRGKTECWYVLDAESGAKIAYGMKKTYSRLELEQAIADQTLEDCVEWVSVKRGDFIYIPSGTVHAIGGGLRLLEVQQSCDITYRLYDWGRGRECHVQKGLDSVKWQDELKVYPFAGDFECPYFKMHLYEQKGNWKLNGEKVSGQQVAVVFVLEGKGTLNGLDAAGEDVFALEAGEGISGSGDFKIMVISS